MGRFITCEWILLKDRLPSVEEVRANDTYICTDGIGVYVRRYSFRMRGFVVEKNGREVMMRGIVAWMHLPKPYKPED